MRRPNVPCAGFTLIEMLLVMALLSIIAALGVPKLLNLIQRQKILGTAQQTAMLLRLARLNAVKTSANCVVTASQDLSVVRAFNDANRNNTLDVDETELGRLDLPKGVVLTAVSGFTPQTAPNPPVAVFRSDGSITATGAFQFKDANGDQLEARVMTTSGGQVQIRKELSGAWYAQGEGGKTWVWN